MATARQVQFINPAALHANPAFTNVILVSGSVKAIYVGGQDSVDSSGAIVGRGDFRAQAEQVLKNIQAALAAAGAGLHHLIKWNIIVVHGQDLRPGLEVFQRAWETNLTRPPSLSYSCRAWPTPTSCSRWTPLQSFPIGLPGRPSWSWQGRSSTLSCA